MADTPATITLTVKVDISKGHSDPATLPQWMYDEFPLQVLGYVINGYLAGVEVGRRVSTGGTDDTSTVDGEPKASYRWPHAQCDDAMAHACHVWGNPEHWCKGLMPAGGRAIHA